MSDVFNILVTESPSSYEGFDIVMKNEAMSAAFAGHTSQTCPWWSKGMSPVMMRC
jgi:hypothetical protein